MLAPRNTNIAQLPSIICLLFATVPALAQDAETAIRLEVRDVRSAPLNGYLLVRPAPPSISTMTGLTVPAAAGRYYDYFRDPLAGGNFAVDGETAPAVTNGVIEFKQSSVQSDGGGLAGGTAVWMFFFWSSTGNALPNTGTPEERLARTDRVVWWTLHLDASEGPSKSLLQNVTVLDRLSWTENRDFREAPFGRPAGPLDGYIPGKQEHVALVLEPPLNAEGRVIASDASRPGYRHPVLLVHGIGGNAASWALPDGTSIAQYLRARNFPVWELYYGAYQGSQEVGDFIQTALGRVRQAQTRPNLTLVDVVTHGSAGAGLRSVLRRASTVAPMLGRVLMLAPPYRGIHQAIRLRNYQEVTLAALAQRMAPFGPGFHDPLAPAFPAASPGSTVQLAIEGPGEPLAQFREWTAERGALTLAGNNPGPLEAVDPENREAPGHSDGLVSLSSASLRDLDVPFATANLSHFDFTGTETSATILAAFLEDPRNVLALQEVESGDVVTTANCGESARGGLLVDLREFTGCAASGGLASVRFDTPDGDWLNLAQANVASFYYWSTKPEPLLPGAASYEGTALFLGAAKNAELEGKLRISCRNPGSDAYERQVRLKACQTNYLPTRDADTAVYVPPPVNWTLTVLKEGGGSVTSNPAGLSCDSTCRSATWNQAAGTVVLTASPQNLFRAWGGACSGTALTCTITMNSNVNVIAYFAGSGAALFSLTLTPNILYPGRSAAATLNLTEPAPAGGLLIPLSNSSPASAITPTSIFVPRGQQSASIVIPRGAGSTPAILTARYGGKEITETLWTVDTPLALANPTAFRMEFIAVSAGPISNAFELGKYEVTQAQWAAVYGRNPSGNKGDNLPVEFVDWDQIQEFLARLNSLNDGYRYRLPTSAEWEHAANAGQPNRYSREVQEAEAWLIHNSRVTRPVGQKAPNPWGFFDMVGNVGELVADWNDGATTGSLLGPRFQGLERGCSVACQYWESWYQPSGLRVITGSKGFRVARDRVRPPAAFAIADAVFVNTIVPSGSMAVARVTLNSPAPLGGLLVTAELDLGGASATLASALIPAGMTDIALTLPSPAINSDQLVNYTFRLGATSTRGAQLRVTPRISAGVPTAGPAGLMFIAVPPGEYIRGCSDFDYGCLFYERPAHPVKLTKGFEIGQYEVTNGQWTAVMGGSLFGDPQMPAVMSWFRAVEFANRLTARGDGYRYRLPTEAEWEWAARAGTTGRETGVPPDELSWHWGNNFSRVHPVGLKRPNLWGIYDMIGNAWEWVQDWYSDYTTAPLVDPVGPATGTAKVSRGYAGPSNLNRRIEDLRSLAVGPSRRAPDDPNNTGSFRGFRMARERVAGGPPAALTGFTIESRTELMPGQSAVGTITVSGWAPPGGYPISVRASEPDVLSVPGTVTMRAGLSEDTFVMKAGPVTGRSNVTLTFQAGSVSRTHQIAVVPLHQASEPVEGAAGIKFVSIPAGEYSRGCSVGDEESCLPLEVPRHTVRLTKPFEIGQYEVTQQQWQEVMGSNPSQVRDPSRPVETVSRDQILGFLGGLNAREDGYRYRLPTEAEWEWAARAGTSDRYLEGTAEELAWSASNSDGRTRPVGLKKPNAWGLYDVLGNVAEFINEWIGFYGIGPDTNPGGAFYLGQGPGRVIKGGSFRDSALGVRVSIRNSTQDTGGPHIGFRVVREKL